jgi:hypothetical protein
MSSIRWGVTWHLELLEMEGLADDPPVGDPLVALVGGQPVGHQPLDPKDGPLLAELALLVRQDLAEQLRVAHHHPRLRTEPCQSDFTCNNLGDLSRTWAKSWRSITIWRTTA